MRVSVPIVSRVMRVTGALLRTVTQAMSEPYVLTCKVQRLQNMPHWEMIDRIFVDEPTQGIDFVASTTIGTDKEVFVSFGNRPGYVAFGGNNTVTFYRFGNSLRINAMRFGFPAAIWVEPPIVRVIAMRNDGYEEAVFACTR
ncbi:MAG: hypothetical protein ACXW3T_13100 [Rhodoplanes sp.]